MTRRGLHLVKTPTNPNGPVFKHTFKNDLTGQRFSRLLVLGEAPKELRRRPGRITWICACDCGEFCLTEADLLKNGHTRSCGCIARERYATFRIPERNPGRYGRAGKPKAPPGVDPYDFFWGKAA
jgi:hypothetical protein